MSNNSGTIKELVAKLRTLCSPTCEISDELRLNYFTKYGNEACVLLEQMEEELTYHLKQRGL